MNGIYTTTPQHSQVACAASDGDMHDLGKTLRPHDRVVSEGSLTHIKLKEGNTHARTTSEGAGIGS